MDAPTSWEITKGKTIALGLTRQRAHPCCLADAIKHFPELAELFKENQRRLEAVDRALAEREIAVQAFKEALEKSRKATNSPAQNPHDVRNLLMGRNPGNPAILLLTPS